MRAFLLAAGKGTRLSPITDKIPKCLVPIQGTPLLKIWIRLLAQAGVTHVLINTHHHARQVEDYLKNLKNQHDIEIKTFHEEKLLGSGGTIMANRCFVSREKDFLIAYADNLTNLDIDKMVKFHLDTKPLGNILTMGLFHAPDPKACGIAVLDREHRIVDFEEKPENPAGDLANGGIYLASDIIFDYFPKQPDTGNDNVIDLGYHVLPRLKGKMFGYEIKEYLKDIGTLDSYRSAEKNWPGERIIQ